MRPFYCWVGSHSLGSGEHTWVVSHDSLASRRVAQRYLPWSRVIGVIEMVFAKVLGRLFGEVLALWYKNQFEIKLFIFGIGCYWDSVYSLYALLGNSQKLKQNLQTLKLSISHLSFPIPCTEWALLSFR